jgi:cell division protein FtsZ
MAIILAGESGNAEGNGNEQVVRHCLNSPSFDIDYRTATGCIVLIAASQEFTSDDAEEIVGSFTRELDPTADIVWCSRIKKTNRRRVRIYGIMTGIQKKSCEN